MKILVVDFFLQGRKENKTKYKIIIMATKKENQFKIYN